MDIDAAELQKPTIRPDLPVHADVKDVLVSLLESGFDNTSNAEQQKWLKWCRDIDARYPGVL